MWSKLIKKELSIISRSIQLRIAGILFIALMITAVLVGKQGQQKIQLELFTISDLEALKEKL